jgi:hypothetical protein
MVEVEEVEDGIVFIACEIDYYRIIGVVCVDGVEGEECGRLECEIR